MRIHRLHPYVNKDFYIIKEERNEMRSCIMNCIILSYLYIHHYHFWALVILPHIVLLWEWLLSSAPLKGSLLIAEEKFIRIFRRVGNESPVGPVIAFSNALYSHVVPFFIKTFLKLNSINHFIMVF